MASTAAITAAPPAMSVRMRCMPSAGFTEMPPVSNVMPLPTSTTCGAPRLPWLSCTNLGGRVDPPPTASMPPNPCWASQLWSRTVASTPGARPAVRVAVRASQAGSLTFDGVLARSRASPVAAASTAARFAAAPSSASAVSAFFATISRTVRARGLPGSPVTAKV